MSEILVAPTNSLGKGEELMKEVLKSLNEADKQMEELDTEFRVLKSRADKSLQAKFTALKKRYNKARSDYFQHSEVLSDLRNRKELYRSPVSRTVVWGVRSSSSLMMRLMRSTERICRRRESRQKNSMRWLEWGRMHAT
eukprot:TRINITY_DN8774_c0_g1_i21.p2 TRINITY_DN8774_c0_g1~~TRINITY_DN8774_c0_g1_i21.p2  ORF type:complete len:139 (-),score=30.31 TRINITY_DN8774_c0_g1_i21:319-735(-)